MPRVTGDQTAVHDYKRLNVWFNRDIREANQTKMKKKGPRIERSSQRSRHRWRLQINWYYVLFAVMPDFVPDNASRCLSAAHTRSHINACNKQISISFSIATTRKTATTRRLNHIDWYFAFAALTWLLVASLVCIFSSYMQTAVSPS